MPALSQTIDVLARRYPSADRRSIASIVQQAHATVHRLIGHPDLSLTEALAQLRLDVRENRNYASSNPLDASANC